MFVEVGTTDLHPLLWFMDTRGREYWLHKEMHAKGRWPGFRHGSHNMYLLSKCMIARGGMEVDPKHYNKHNFKLITYVKKKKLCHYGVVSRVPATQFRFSTRSGILISTLGLGVCPFCSVLCCLCRRSWHSTDHRFREARPCVFV